MAKTDAAGSETHPVRGLPWGLAQGRCRMQGSNSRQLKFFLWPPIKCALMRHLRGDTHFIARSSLKIRLRQPPIGKHFKAGKAAIDPLDGRVSAYKCEHFAKFDNSSIATAIWTS